MTITTLTKHISTPNPLDKVYTTIYTHSKEETTMETAKVFTNGGSQAIRLPKNCRFDSDEVTASKIGKIVILMPKDDSWAELKQGLELFSDDFLKDGIDQLPLQERTAI